jgi:hypothetical protein
MSGGAYVWWLQRWLGVVGDLTQKGDKAWADKNYVKDYYIHISPSGSPVLTDSPTSPFF